jgi:predicted nuclease of predicted toxin-antitoxin system
VSGEETPVFFLDENLLGRNVADSLRNAGVRVELLSDHFPTQTPDVEWLAEVSQRGWLVLTRDMAIGVNIPEAIAVAQGNAKMFALVMGEAPTAELVRDVVNALPKMERFAQSHPAPFIAKVYPFGKVRKWLDRHKLLKTLNQFEADSHNL